jgi:hypothetical protein
MINNTGNGSNELVMQGCKNFQKSRSHLKILGVRASKFHTKSPQIFGITVEILVPTATWRLCTPVLPG